MKFKIIAVLFFVLASCSLIPSYKLTDSNVKAYIKAYKSLYDFGVSFESTYAEDYSGNKSFNKMEGITKRAGFKDFHEFLLVNFEVGKVMSLLQSREYIDAMEKMIDGDMPGIQEILNDPDIPESAKKETRETLKKVRAEWDKQKNTYAMPILNIVEKFTDKENYQVVLRHKEALLKVYIRTNGMY